MMDKRIGYGLTFDEAIKKAVSAIQELPAYCTPITNFSLGGGDIWAELRDDGWRVYRKRTQEESIMSDKLGSEEK